MDVFPLIIKPDWGLSSNPEADIEEQKLGDGYIVRRPKGLNYIKESWSPSWGMLEREDWSNTYEWLKSRLNLTTFLWNHPTEEVSPGVPKQYKVVCTKLSKVESDVGIFGLSATFVQDFNL